MKPNQMARYASRYLFACFLIGVCRAATQVGFGGIVVPITVSCGNNNTDPITIQYEGDIAGMFASVDCQSEKLASGLYRLTIINKALCHMWQFHNSDAWVVKIFIQSIDQRIISFGDPEYSVTCHYSEEGQGVSSVRQVIGQPAGGANDGFDDAPSTGGDSYISSDACTPGMKLRMEDSLGNHLTHVKVGQEVRLRVANLELEPGFCLSKKLAGGDEYEEESTSDEDCPPKSENATSVSVDCNLFTRGVFQKCNTRTNPLSFIQKCEKEVLKCNRCKCDPALVWKSVCKLLGEYVCQCENEKGIHIDWLPYNNCPNMQKGIKIMTCAVHMDESVTPMRNWCESDADQLEITGNRYTVVTPYVTIPAIGDIEYMHMSCQVYTCPIAVDASTDDGTDGVVQGGTEIRTDVVEAEYEQECLESCMAIHALNESAILTTVKIRIHPADIISGPPNDPGDDMSDDTSYDVNKDRKPVLLDNCGVTSPNVLPYLIVIIILSIAIIALIIAIIFLVRRLRARETTGCTADPQPYAPPTWPHGHDPRKYDVRMAQGRPSTYRGASTTTQTAGPRQRSYYGAGAPSPPRETGSVAGSEIEDPLERMRIQLEGILPSTSGLPAAPPSRPPAPPPMPSIGPQASTKSLRTFESEAGPSRPDTSETSIKL